MIAKKWLNSSDFARYKKAFSQVGKQRERRSVKQDIRTNMTTEHAESGRITDSSKKTVRVFPENGEQNSRNISSKSEQIATDVLRDKMDAWIALQTDRKSRTLKSAEEIKEAALQEYDGPLCPYCGSRSVIKTAEEHRGKAAQYCYWVCPECPNVSVTTSGNSYFPSGLLADAETRRMRGEVQQLLNDKKKELKYDRFALNEWIQETLQVYPEKAWVGQLDKNELAQLAKETQKDLYQKRHAYIFSNLNLK